jgi:hypothetical protein
MSKAFLILMNMRQSKISFVDPQKLSFVCPKKMEGDEYKIEHASNGRAKCTNKPCGENLGKGELRIGEFFFTYLLGRALDSG